MLTIRTLAPLLSVLALLSTAARADLLAGSLPGIDFGGSIAEIEILLEAACDELQRIDVAAPSLPLAAESESHLICEDLATGNGPRVDEAAFTFGDGALVLIEARSGAVEAFVPHAGERAWSFSGYDVYMPSQVVTRSDEDAVWILSAEALHPHLYLRRNPYLPSFTGSTPFYDTSAARPEILAFGASLEELLPRLKSDCPKLENQVIDPPWLPTGPENQLQMNCYGYVFAGFPRKIEAVFGDERLELAWILTGKGEENRVRQALIEAFGEPIFVSEEVEAFDEWNVALRKDKPEVLMVIDELAPIFRQRFAGGE